MILNKFSKRFQKNRFPFLQKLQIHETELFFWELFKRYILINQEYLIFLALKYSWLNKQALTEKNGNVEKGIFSEKQGNIVWRK